MNKTLLYFFFTFFALDLPAQKPGTLHIVTKRNNLPAPLKFNFEINGQTFKLKDGECMDVPISADSVHLVLFDKRLIKQETTDLHIVSGEHLYVWVYFTFEGYLKNGRFAAEIVCRECYDEIKSKCK